MSIKIFKSTDKTQLTEHFNVQEFRCKCGGSCGYSVYAYECYWSA